MKQTVTVTLAVVVECSSNWGDDCTIGQLKKQARIDAADRLHKYLNNDPLVKSVTTKEVSLMAVL